MTATDPQELRAAIGRVTTYLEGHGVLDHNDLHLVLSAVWQHLNAGDTEHWLADHDPAGGEYHVPADAELACDNPACHACHG